MDPRRDIPGLPAPPATSPAGAGAAWDALFAAIVLAVAAAAAVLPPMVQNLEYHRFADRRAFLHVPNALDVLSNLGFVVAGVAGLRAARDPRAFPDPRARPAWLVLFGGVLATAAGSAYYHLAPTSPRLVWDRLPMAAAFMALVAALAGERFGAAVGRRLLWRLVAAGVATVVWWGARDGQGQGNLLPYYVVQVGAVAAVPLLLVGRPREAGPRAPWGVALVLYVVAKALEDHDRAVFDTLGVSGHTLKHLAAAAAIGALVLELRRRARAWRPAAADARPSTPGDGSGGTSDRAASRR